MATVNTYLTFNGNCEEAFLFYKSVFGGDFAYMGRFGEMPPSDDPNCPPPSDEETNRIMHVSLPISKETILMGSDTTSQSGNAVFGTNFSVSINTDTKDEADKLFNGLSADGTIIMPMEKTFWGAYFGMFTDKFGIGWMVNFDETPQ
ncbi:VOC family protein [Flavobacterium aquatile]|uniref:Glyoxalase n=1 Tax=Flavobacterium aquatile LMG 4008 = ATCC 11947 TaxID=1453498 RepID=A0A095TWP0_9FLAO|nr:VOC family protein [Flavobacterium aquatile]KGD66778.1 glyoxalase [Flavobacterium aquatile LMG 4008 = ATCC 11947]OXA67875.1 VOC family protein [Flavobacterium aquatile] [Flavobacterium aquatile LMG 4008 = ATCC 11947]GEC78720.1 VOC family protein [Flavobacterium aquatile]